MKKQTCSEFEIIIKPNKNWLYIDWKGLIQYRDLLFLLVRRNFVASYKQTIIGPGWIILQPLVTTFALTVVFGKVVKISTDGLPPILFYFCALVPWGFFVQSLTGVASHLRTNASLFQKVYFPRLIMALSMVFSNFLVTLIQFVTFLGFYIYYKWMTPAGADIQPNLGILLIPLLFLQIALLSMGFGLWFASLAIKYRDVTKLMAFFTQLWMYATPIIYPISLVSDKWKIILYMNPMAQIVELFRYVFFGTGYVNGVCILVSTGMTCVVFITGLFFFNKQERNFVDII